MKRKSLFRRFRKNQTVVPIPKPDLPPLIGEAIDPEDQHEVLRVFPEIAPTGERLGRTLFSLHQAQDYGQSLPLSPRIIWLMLLGLGAAVNVQSVRTTVENNIPAQWYPLKSVLTFSLSLGLIKLIDWVISSELKTYLSKEDAKREKQQLLERENGGTGEIQYAVIKGEFQAYTRVQSKHLPGERRLIRLKRGLLAIAYVIEIGAALYSMVAYGENTLLTSYLAPLVGVLFSGLSGLYRGIKIEYPKRRHQIGCHYLTVALEQPLESLGSNILTANTVTEAFLRNPKLQREAVEHILHDARQTEIDAKFAQAFNQLTENYRQGHLTLTSHHEQALEALEHQEGERKKTDRSIQNPQAKRLKFQRSKNRLIRKYLDEQLRLIEETEQSLTNLYRQYPVQNQGDCPFRQELAAKKQDIHTQRSRLILEDQMMNNPEAGSSEPLPQQDDREEKPFDTP